MKKEDFELLHTFTVEEYNELTAAISKAYEDFSQHLVPGCQVNSKLSISFAEPSTDPKTVKDGEAITPKLALACQMALVIMMLAQSGFVLPPYRTFRMGTDGKKGRYRSSRLKL